MKKIIFLLIVASNLGGMDNDKVVNEEKAPFKIPATIPIEVQEAQKRLIEQLKEVVVLKKLNLETQIIVAKELIQAPPKKYPKPILQPAKKSPAQKSTSVVSQELDDLLKELEASAPKKSAPVHDPVITTLGELELLTAQASLIAEGFGTSQEIDKKTLLGLIKELNKKSDSLANLVPTYTPSFARPATALRRLDSFVKTMQETNASWAERNTTLQHLSSLISIKQVLIHWVKHSNNLSSRKKVNLFLFCALCFRNW